MFLFLSSHKASITRGIRWRCCKSVSSLFLFTGNLAQFGLKHSAVNRRFGSSNLSVPVITLLLRRNTKQKEGIYIILISKKEMQYLQSKDVKFGENGISKTHSRNSGNTYYATENRYITRLLDDYRKRQIIFTKVAN